MKPFVASNAGPKERFSPAPNLAKGIFLCVTCHCGGGASGFETSPSQVAIWRKPNTDLSSVRSICERNKNNLPSTITPSNNQSQPLPPAGVISAAGFPSGDLP